MVVIGTLVEVVHIRVFYLTVDELQFRRKKNKILAQYHYIPIYKFKIYNKKFYYPNAEFYFKNTISLPIFYNYTYRQYSYVASVINNFFTKNFR